MIPLKSTEEIKIMKVAGKKLAGVMKILLIEAKVGVSLETIEELANELIKRQGARVSFKMVKDYHWATCLNINQGVVHGVPTDYRLKKGDFLSIDLGLFYQGFHADMARTIVVGKETSELKDEEKKFLRTGEKAFEKAIQTAKPGKRIGHLSRVIETEIKKAGFEPIQALVGHGVGKKLHEPPAIPCYLKEKIVDTPRLKPGMVLAIEVIYTQGEPDVMVKEDGWTVETVDSQIAGLFENTVAISRHGPKVMTQL